MFNEEQILAMVLAIAFWMLIALKVGTGADF